MRGDDNDLPQVELIGADAPDGGVLSETSITNRRSTSGHLGAIALVLGVAVLLVAGVVASRDDSTAPDQSSEDQPDDQPAERGPTSSPPVAPVDDGDIFLTGAPAPVFGSDVERLVLMGSAGGGWRTLELSSGRVRGIPALSEVEPDQLRPVPGGVLVMDRQAGELHRVGLPDGASEPVRVELNTPELARLNDLVPAGPDRFWAIGWAFGEGSTRRYATMTSADGSALGDAMEIPDDRPVAGSAHGLIYNAGGRMFQVGAGGNSDLGPGVALAAWDTTLAYLSCDELAECSVVVRDLDSGETSGSYAVPSAAAVRGRDGVTVAIGPDGALALVPVRLDGLAWGGSGGVLSTTLTVSSAGGPASEVVVQSPKAGPVWLPDGGVLMLTSRGLVRFDQHDGELVEMVASGLRPARETAVFTLPT